MGKDDFKIISSEDELIQVFEKAKRESWTELALAACADDMNYLGRFGWSSGCTYQVNSGVNCKAVLPDCINEQTGLSLLVMIGLELGPEEARIISSMIGLNNLNLSHNSIGDEGAKYISKLSNLIHLSLRHNDIGDKGAKHLSSLIGLSELHLSSNRIGVEGVEQISRLPHLSKVYLSSNSLDDDSASCLSSMVGLTQLIISHNSIGVEGVKYLAALTGLTRLNFSNNNINDDSVKYISKLPCLNRLGLGDNGIGAEGVKYISDLTSLTRLDLWCNCIGNEGVKYLSILRNLTHLNLRSNSIDNEGVKYLSTLENLTRLYLGDNNIDAEGVKHLSGLSHLDTLSLWCNDVGDEGVEYISALRNLTHLNLRSNNIGCEGAKYLSSLIGLTELQLGGNSIGNDGAKHLSSLIGLIELYLGGNSIGTEGAKHISQLSHLAELHLEGNDIGDAGAKHLSRLFNLTKLYLDDNGIGNEGIRYLSRLSSLAELGLLRNCIDAISIKYLSDMTSLIELNLSGNCIDYEGIISLLKLLSDRKKNQLSGLYLRGNNFKNTTLPQEILESGDAQAILAAYKRYVKASKEDELQPFNEVKLILVGNEAVGKTSLVKFLVKDEPCDSNEQKTPGINITKGWIPDGSPISLNVWDFGGQEIMRGTHKYFLTERSLYLVVLDARCEDDRSVYDWLRTIKNRGGEPPVIVVINKCDHGRDLALNERKLKKEFPWIVCIMRTSCENTADARGKIQCLRNCIREITCEDDRLKHARDGVPGDWIDIKNEITKESHDEPVLHISKFHTICERFDVTNADEQRAVLRLLNDLGVVIARGLDKDSLAVHREITLLEPNWLTTAIYTVLNSPIVREQNAEFKRGDMASILDDPIKYPVGRHEFIIEMMMDKDVRLCLEIKDSGQRHFLVPNALSPNTPDYDDIWPINSLRFRYEYELLMPSLVPQFIAQAYSNLTSKPTMWRTGILLEASGCKALVEADTDKQKLDIRIAGTGGVARSALGVILNYLQIVHVANPEAKPKAFVPLPDDPEKQAGYEHLLFLEEQGEIDYFPEGATKKYKVGDLLNGVRRESHSVEVLQPRGDTFVTHNDFRGSKIVSSNLNAGTSLENITQSLQSVPGVDKNELAEVMSGLSQALEQAIQQGKQEEAQEVYELAEDLAEKAQNPDTKPSLMRLSKKGLIEAATTLAVVVPAVLPLAQRLIEMF